MKNLKICVYAISKNEEKFVDRWVESMKEADEIFVLDTGSTDNTVKKLKEKNVHVKTKIISPWRFDVARNESLKMVPKNCDICVCTDLDEVFEPGWRKELEAIWEKNTTRVRYNYIWSFDKYQKPAVNFYIEKIHTRKNYQWTHPVHEILTSQNINENFKTTDKITLKHYPDSTKSRSNYLPLLELSIKEDPNDDRNMHYLGREYMFNEKYNEAIDTLIKHLSLPKATWKDERCASMRFIARCYISLNRINEAKMWLENAILEAPYLRDPYVERALLSYQLEEWDDLEKYAKKALEINTKQKTYINEQFSWDNTIYDILSIAFFYQNKVEEALEYVKKALEYAPTEERLLDNKNLFEEILENKDN